MNDSTKFVVTLLAVALVIAVVRVLRRPATSAPANMPQPNTAPPKPINIATIRISPGTFMMGDPADTDPQSDDHVHQVAITKAYLIGKYPVTVAEFSRFVSASESCRKYDRSPWMPARPDNQAHSKSATFRRLWHPAHRPTSENQVNRSCSRPAKRPVLSDNTSLECSNRA